MSISTHLRSELKKRTAFGTLRRKASIGVGRKQLSFGRPGGDLGSRTEPKPAKDPGDVVACRALGDPEPRGDLAVGEPAGDQDGYLVLSGRELVSRCLRRLGHG